MASTFVRTAALCFGGGQPRPAALEHRRKDTWRLSPLLTCLGLGTFVVYATWAALQGADYHIGNLPSPFYSPEIWGRSPHALFGPQPAWLPWPSFMPFSAAVIVLAIPGNFRLTCYHYRGAYSKAFWSDPVACGVGESRDEYRGERWMQLVPHNAHRSFLYDVIFVWFFQIRDVWKAPWFAARGGGEQFGLSVGGLLLAINSMLLWLYCTGCHSLRHLMGGHCDEFSKNPVSCAYGGGLFKPLISHQNPPNW